MLAALLLLCSLTRAGVRGLEHYLSNAALLEAQCRPLALRELEAAPIAHAVDGSLPTGWSWGAELDGAEAIFVLDSMHALTGVRVYSGVGTGRLITRFRLWYATSVPENISDAKFFTGGWGMSHGQWRDVPFLQAEDSEDELLAVQDNIVLTARPDTMLAFPPLLVRALKVAIEDTNVEALPAVLNEFQAIAPRHLNPGIDAPEGVLRPARGYIWPLYNASHAWHASSCRACRADYGEGLQGDPGAHIEEFAAADAGGESSALEPWFSWDGALEHNESMVLGTLRARVHVHNFAVPEQGTLELYVQNTRAAWTDQDTSIKLSIAALNHGLHVFTARLRGRDGEWLPFSARRVAFVGARPPVHPWLLTHDIEVVGDGLSAARVGERATFRIHVSETARQDAGHARRPPARGAPEESEAQESACKGENCGDSGGGGGGGGASGREDATDVTGAVSGATGQAVLLSVKELPWLTSSWTHAYRGLEHWTVELRGPAIISGRVVPNGAVAGARTCPLSFTF
jgi:hypothetical protein